MQGVVKHRSCDTECATSGESTSHDLLRIDTQLFCMTCEILEHASAILHCNRVRIFWCEAIVGTNDYRIEVSKNIMNPACVVRSITNCEAAAMKIEECRKAIIGLALDVLWWYVEVEQDFARDEWL